MTSISFTSGELLDIISTLEDKAENLEESANFHLAAYYYNIIDQLDRITEKLEQFQPENKVANLVLAVN
jgi:excinuclease UvrABC nuclease subunit